MVVLRAQAADCAGGIHAEVKELDGFGLDLEEEGAGGGVGGGEGGGDCEGIHAGVILGRDGFRRAS